MKKRWQSITSNPTLSGNISQFLQCLRKIAKFFFNNIVCIFIAISYIAFKRGKKMAHMKNHLAEIWKPTKIVWSNWKLLVTYFMGISNFFVVEFFFIFVAKCITIFVHGLSQIENDGKKSLCSIFIPLNLATIQEIDYKKNF